MATSKILYLGEGSNRLKGKRLKAAIDYISNPEKTQDGRLIGSVNCLADSAYEQMIETKKAYDKVDKRQGYHLIISFKEGEVSADTAFEIISRFVEEYLGSDYEAIYAVHDNTDHIHGHIIFNSVKFTDGKKYRYEKGDWARYIQPITNRLCEEYGVSIIEIESDNIREDRKQPLWNESKDGPFIWSDMIMKDLDIFIAQAKDFEQFLLLLKESGYEIKQGKHLAIKPPGMNRFRRCKTLGENYSEERIRERIKIETAETFKQETMEEAERIIYSQIPGGKRAKLSPLQKLYYRRLYEIGLLKRKPYSKAWQFKDDIKKMHKLQAQYKFLLKYEIQGKEHLMSIVEHLTEQKKELVTEANQVYRKRARCEDLFQIAAKMAELYEAECEYNAGDNFFLEEHEKWTAYDEKLREQGHSYESVLALKAQIRKEIADARALEKELYDDIKAARSILKEIEDAAREKNKEIEYKKDRKQPTR